MDRLQQKNAQIAQWLGWMYCPGEKVEWYAPGPGEDRVTIMPSPNFLGNPDHCERIKSKLRQLNVRYGCEFLGNHLPPTERFGLVVKFVYPEGYQERQWIYTGSSESSLFFQLARALMELGVK